MNKEIKTITWILRLGVFCTFLGHGSIALGIKESWLPLITSFGISMHTALILMPIIGVIDIAVAFLALLYPARIVLLWAICWAFMAALSRVVAGESFWEFVERTAEFACPLALLLIYRIPKKRRELFSYRKSE